MKIKIEGQNREVDIYSEEGLELISRLWTKATFFHKIVYEPTWLGIPIIQLPGDMVMMQELIWKVRPDIIIETGVAHGGSAVLYASILELLGKGRVMGVDIEIRKHNEIAIKSHPMSKRITLVEGNSCQKSVVEMISRKINPQDTVMVVLDSSHSYEHVLREMELYSPLVSQGSYLVVMDGVQGMLWDTPSGKKEWQHDNPMKAIETFLQKHPGWEVDTHYNRLHVSYSPGGFLRRK